MRREVAALMTGIIIAGRTGAAFAAELVTMKVTRRSMRTGHLGNHLVLPRLLGLFLTMPLLTLYADVIGIVGGMVVSRALLDLSFTQFMNGLLAALVLGITLVVAANALVDWIAALLGK